mmetsp:Transcript_1615/g.2545  ORF Transcript_1615/g.2545 Transcript_1615/m.2545 type:complete len:320 (+) Transcript_1615:520-1479(+)|eukprot:CAMPEP_0184527746 /NCGR_PEP_ID=MMETSP0198_2-20121128/11397_1 /TAXON_ID=1112570 /ORGANISM="Thraustochytrium sp., Strain LLF1b" /LENGTH=319 /DNA_ID=CAMNT_0026919495 /DNA_START=509 /DNA_END=1468 /DNA_ORIENTATION=-
MGSTFSACCDEKKDDSIPPNELRTILTAENVIRRPIRSIETEPVLPETAQDDFYSSSPDVRRSLINRFGQNRTRSESAYSTSSAVQIIQTNQGSQSSIPEIIRLSPIGDPIQRTRAYTEMNAIAQADQSQSYDSLDNYIYDDGGDLSESPLMQRLNATKNRPPGGLRRTISCKTKLNAANMEERLLQSDSSLSSLNSDMSLEQLSSPVYQVLDPCDTVEPLGVTQPEPVPSESGKSTRGILGKVLTGQVKNYDEQLAAMRKEAKAKRRAKPEKKPRHKRSQSSFVTSSSPLICQMTLDEISQFEQEESHSFKHRSGVLF